MGRKVKDRTGFTHGSWTVTKFVGFSSYGDTLWECSCSCGLVVTKTGGNLRGASKRGCYHAPNLLHKTFNDWTVIGKQKSEKSGKPIIWLCICSCGKSGRVQTSSLVNGKSKSCRHNGTNTIHGMSDTRFYSIWSGMKERCSRKRHMAYPRYGGRGINVRWKRFEDFRNDMYQGYLEHVRLFGEKQTTIDRINGDDDYFKENCRWATYKAQNNNKKKTPSG